MKLDTPEISWHGREPIYSLDFQPLSTAKKEPRRLATAGCGNDGNLRMWYIRINNDGKATAEFASNMSRHTKSVNVVRFSPDGQILSSGGDDCLVILWRLTDTQGGGSAFGKEDEESKEGWNAFKMLRGHLEDVYDLSWSPDGTRLLSGSVDNSAIIWDVTKGEKLVILKDHRSFVQGVAWDPLGKYCATLSCDRSLRLYNLNNNRCAFNIVKMTMSSTSNNGESTTKQCRLFHDDSMKSFFRRLTFSPDGQLLIVPSGSLEVGDSSTSCNTTYIFTRSSVPRPVMYLPGATKATIAVRCCPVLFELRKPEEELKEPKDDSVHDESMDTSTVTNDVTAEKSDNPKEIWPSVDTEPSNNEPISLFNLPYRIVFAVLTEDSLILYDSQQSIPFGMISNIHYHQLSDVTWSPDGRVLVVSSTDGFCSLVTFEEGEIGIPFEKAPIKPIATEAPKVNSQAAGSTSVSSNQAQPPPLNIHDVKANQGEAVIIRKIEPRRVSPTGPTNNPPAKTNGSGARRICTTLLSSPTVGEIHPRVSSSQSSPTTSNNSLSPSTSCLTTQPQPSRQSLNAVQPRRIQLTTIKQTDGEIAPETQPTTIQPPVNVNMPVEIPTSSGNPAVLMQQDNRTIIGAPMEGIEESSQGQTDKEAVLTNQTPPAGQVTPRRIMLTKLD
ncbi:chromatin assembly factor 1 subunit B-like isoform X1 [Asterias rubens]|uniref:chromatin assembly factor 1 subunit B-like isoform X1 n=1 Tax=Asterias rubens TaxID=7604 RepID=UPI001454F1F5|nr:chromatin assembly factor 1 subunit B-like isoform X1 [Asterias rubens]